MNKNTFIAALITEALGVCDALENGLGAQGSMEAMQWALSMQADGIETTILEILNKYYADKDWL